MIDYITGTVTELNPAFAVVECNGIGYGINISLNTFSALEKDTSCRILIHEAIREDAHLLYGFATESEKDVFLRLISVSGIGPTTALAIIAVDDNEGLVRAIDQQNITYLTKFPKIGKKTAQQMVLDLAGTFVDTSVQSDAVSQTAAASNQALEEAMEALLALGYKANEIKKIRTFFEGTSESAENYIKSALKMLMK